MNGFWHAIAFLTRLRVPPTLEADGWRTSAAWYPAVGLVVGLILSGWASAVLWLFPAALAAVAVLAGWVWITGGLHLDGWMDTADGLGSARSRERMLEIMKDSRTGAMGAMAGSLLLLGKWAALYGILSTASGASLYAALIVPPVLARMGLVGSIAWYPYLEREGKGIAAGLKEGLTPYRAAASLAASFLVAIAAGGLVFGLISVVVWFVCLAGWNRYVISRLGGLTGDTYGALVELAETVLLAAAAACLHRGGGLGWFS